MKLTNLLQLVAAIVRWSGYLRTMRFAIRQLLWLLPLVTLIFPGCERAPSSVLPPSVVSYAVRGVLQSADATNGRAVIAHEEIPGYMAAMTMEFTAAQPVELAGLVPGDVLIFELRVMERESRIAKVKKVGHSALATPFATTPAEDATGTLLPDVALVDEHGRPFRLAETKGGALAVTFIFTRCPLPDFCPRMNAHFATVQRALSASTGKWRLLSVTMDPAYDTPARLAEYAARYQPDQRWSFATGEATEIAKLTAAFGLETKGEGAALTHNLRTIVVDATGRVLRVFTGNEWQPEELIAEMRLEISAEEK